jgi:hypothetical protein
MCEALDRHAKIRVCRTTSKLPWWPKTCTPANTPPPHMRVHARLNACRHGWLWSRWVCAPPGTHSVYLEQSCQQIGRFLESRQRPTSRSHSRDARFQPCLLLRECRYDGPSQLATLVDANVYVGQHFDTINARRCLPQCMSTRMVAVKMGMRYYGCQLHPVSELLADWG